MLERDGKFYARVTEILAPYVDFGPIPEEIIVNKARIGSETHKAIEDLIKGDFPIVSRETRGYTESFQKWTTQLSPTFLASEQRYYDNDRMITGCIDALVVLQGEKEAVLVDFKTSAQENSITWPMQAHLYHYLIKKSGTKISDRILFLKLDKNGMLPKVFQYIFDQRRLFECMRAVEKFFTSLST